MEYSHPEIKAGAMVVACTLLLFVLLAMIGNFGSLINSTQKTYVVVENSSMVKAGTPVYYAGLEAGTVAEVRLLTTTQTNKYSDKFSPRDKAGEIIEKDLVRPHIELVLNIQNNIQIQKTDLVEIVSTLMGDLSIEIQPGPLDSEKIAKDERLFGKIGGMFGTLANMLKDNGDMGGSLLATIDQTREALEKINAIAGRIDGFLADDNGGWGELESKIVGILGNVEKLTGHIEKDWPELSGKVKIDLEEVGKMVATLRETIEENRTTISSMLVGMDRITNDDIPAMMQDINESLKRTLASVETATDGASSMITENRDNLRATMRNLKDASVSFEEFTEYVRRHPWALLKTPPRDAGKSIDLYEASRMLDKMSTELNETASRLETILESPEKLREDEAKNIRIMLQDIHTAQQRAGELKQNVEQEK